MADHKQKSAASGSTTTGSATTGKSTMDKNTTDKNTITATATTTATAVSATSTKADLSTSNSAAPMAAPSLTSKRGSGGGGKKKREAATTTAATTAGVVDVTAGVAAIGLSGGAAYEAAATGATGTTTAATGTTTGTTSGNRRGSRRGSGRGSASVERGHGAGASAGTSGAGTTAGTATHGHHGPARANGHGQGQPAMTSSDRRLAAAIAAGLVVQVQPMDPTLGEREMMEILAVSEPATVAEVNDGSEAAVPATTAAATTTAATTATASHDVDAPTDANRDTTTTSVEEVVTHRPTRVDFFGVYALATYADHTLAQRAITAHNGRAMYRDLTFTVAWPRPGGGPFYVGGGGHGVGSAISGHSSPAFRGGPMAYGASPGPYGTPGSYGTGPYGYGAPRYGGVSPTPYGGSGQRDDGSVKGQQQHQHQFSDGGPPRGRGFPSRQDSEVFSSRGGAQRRMFKNRVWIGDLDGVGVVSGCVVS